MVRRGGCVPHEAGRQVRPPLASQAHPQPPPCPCFSNPQPKRQPSRRQPRAPPLPFCFNPANYHSRVAALVPGQGAKHKAH